MKGKYTEVITFTCATAAETISAVPSREQWKLERR
jgi:hypothetical protein